MNQSGDGQIESRRAYAGGPDGARHAPHLMTEGVIWKRMLLFAVPLILGNLLQQMYNTVDSIIVGNYVGSNALAAVGSSASLINLLIAFSMGASAGAGVVIAQFYGAQNEQGVRSSVHTAVAIAVILGAVLSLAGVLFSPQILIWMGTPAEVMSQSVRYLRLYSMGLIFNVIYNMCAGIVNAVGNSRRSLLYLAVASVTNIFLDLVLVEGLALGVAGAAIATDISQCLAMVLILVHLLRVKDSYRVRFHEIRLQRQMALRIIRIGLPTGIQNMVISFSNVLVQSSVNSFGPAAMAGFGAYVKIDGFNILPVMSLSMAATTFTGQNFGAGKIDRVKRGMWVTLAMCLVYTIFIGVVLVLFSRNILGVFTKDSEVVAYGMLAMRYFCPFYFVLSILHGLAGTVRGTGETVAPMLILLGSMCLFRIVWLQTVFRIWPTLDTVFLLYPVSWAVGAVVMILYTWKGKWLTKYARKSVVDARSGG